MVCKEEVFNWFKELSGAKRIELMCGLMSMCIPLEIRFFEAIVRDLAKKDLNALREAELKANNFQELDQICKCDLLADKAITDSNDLKPNTNCEMTSNAISSNCSLNNTVTVQQSLQSSQPQIQSMPMQDMTTVSANGTAISVATNDMIGPSGLSSPPSSSSNLSLLPSRSKLIISLCLLNSTNRVCSSIAFKALQQQLTAKQISNVVMNCYFRKGCYNFDGLFSEILLLLTMAVHHPAFSYEQRNVLLKQKEEVERMIDSITAQLRQSTANFSANTGHHFHNYHHSSHLQSHPTHALHQQQPQTGPQSVHTSQTPHSHHQLSQGVVPPQQYPSHPHSQHTQYMPVMPGSVTNLPYNTAPLQNISNLRISNMTSPVSTPSPTNSPSSSSKATSVATISPIAADFGHVITHPTESAVNQGSYVLTSGLPVVSHVSTAKVDDSGCAKSVVSCYNCGNLGHRGDECTAQTQEEANR